jgi:phenylacetyl-CoA:acceptor oxidoreductase 26-kDa subunit
MRAVEPELQRNWGRQAAANFCGGGAGAGLLLFTALAAYHDSVWIYRTGPLALVLIGTGLTCVWLEIGRPWRFLNVFRRAGSSWMTREALAASALFPLAFVAVALRLKELTLIAALIGMAFLYCQARMLQASKGIPVWREPAIIPLILSTGITEGLSLFVLIAAVFPACPRWAVPALMVVLVARLIAWQTYRSRLIAPAAAPRRSVAVLNRMNSPLRIAGHLLPLGLLAIALVVPPPGQSLAAVAAILSLAAGWYLKYALVCRASYNQGFAIAHAPARSPGYSRAGAKPGWT